MRTNGVLMICAGTAAMVGVAIAAGGSEKAQPEILDRNPQTHVAKVDQDHLAVHRLDIVDANGVVRMVLAAPTPDPILGGNTYKRVFPVSGLVLYDANGDERGGMAVADIPGSAVVVASDHTNTDAIGWRVSPDGAVDFSIDERPPVETDPATGKVAAAAKATTRVNISVAANGTPAIALADKQNHPRVRITVSPEGYGEIEFLDANGKVVSTMAPEKSAR